MPFAKITTAEAEKLVGEFKVVAKQHADLNKGVNKLTKKSEIAKLAKDMKIAGDKVKANLESSMKTVRGYFEEHAGNVQEWMIQCAKFQKTQSDALARFEKTPAQIHERAIVERVVDEIRVIAEKAAAQDKEYGSAWAELRGYNPVKAGMDAAYCNGFSEIRSKIMNDGKAVTSKIERMRTMVTAAQAVAVKTEAIAKRGLDDIAGARSRASDLAKQAEQVLKDLDTGKGKNVHVIRTTSNTVIEMTKKPPTKENLQQTRDYMTNVANADKYCRERIQLLDKLTKTIKPSFDDDELKDPAIASSLAKVTECHENAKKLLAGVVDNMKAAAAAYGPYMKQKPV